MEKVIKIGDKEIKFKSTAGTLLRYRNSFGRDLLKDLVKLQEKLKNKKTQAEQFMAIDLQMFSEIAWVMAKTADDSIPNIEKWLDQFDTFDIMQILPQLFDLIQNNLKQEQAPKNV